MAIGRLTPRRTARQTEMLRLGEAIRHPCNVIGDGAGFTLSLLGEMLLRRPGRFKDAVSFVILHKAFHGYMQVLGEQLDRANATLESEAIGAAEAE